MIVLSLSWIRVTPGDAASTSPSWGYILSPRFGAASNFFSPGESIHWPQKNPDLRTFDIFKAVGKDSGVFPFDGSTGIGEHGQLANGLSWQQFDCHRLGRECYLIDGGIINVPSQVGDFPSPGIGLTAVRVGSKWGYASNKTGKIVIPAVFSYATAFWDHVAAVSVDYKWGYIRYTGKLDP